MRALRDWTAFLVDVGQWAVYLFIVLAKGLLVERNGREHTTVVTAADTVTPDASFTSPLLAIDEHCRGY